MAYFQAFARTSKPKVLFLGSSANVAVISGTTKGNRHILIIVSF